MSDADRVLTCVTGTPVKSQTLGTSVLVQPFPFQPSLYHLRREHRPLPPNAATIDISPASSARSPALGSHYHSRVSAQSMADGTCQPLARHHRHGCINKCPTVCIVTRPLKYIRERQKLEQHLRNRWDTTKVMPSPCITRALARQVLCITRWRFHSRRSGAHHRSQIVVLKSGPEKRECSPDNDL